MFQNYDTLNNTKLANIPTSKYVEIPKDYQSI